MNAIRQISPTADGDDVCDVRVAHRPASIVTDGVDVLRTGGGSDPRGARHEPAAPRRTAASPGWPRLPPDGGGAASARAAPARARRPHPRTARHGRPRPADERVLGAGVPPHRRARSAIVGQSEIAAGCRSLTISSSGNRAPRASSVGAAAARARGGPPSARGSAKPVGLAKDLRRSRGGEARGARARRGRRAAPRARRARPRRCRARPPAASWLGTSAPSSGATSAITGAISGETAADQPQRRGARPPIHPPSPPPPGSA